MNFKMVNKYYHKINNNLTFAVIVNSDLDCQTHEE